MSAIIIHNACTNLSNIGHLEETPQCLPCVLDAYKAVNNILVDSDGKIAIATKLKDGKYIPICVSAHDELGIVSATCH